MDPQIQQSVADAAKQYDADNIIVVLGTSDAEVASIYAETVTAGDPAGEGPLAGVSLRLPVYHILDPLLKAEANPAAWDGAIFMAELNMNGSRLAASVAEMREQHGVSTL